MNVSLYARNTSAYQYQLAIQERFTEICEPLFKLGINYFSYGAFFETGEYLQLSNQIEFVRNHYFNIKNRGNMWVDLFLKVQNRSHFLIPYNKKDQDLTIDLAASLGCWNGFCIHKKESNYKTAYCFGIDTNDPLFSQFYFNNLSLLEHFCDYFDAKAKDMIDCSDKTRLGAFEQYVDFSRTTPEVLFEQKIQQFLQETFLEKRLLKTRERDIRLSKRETQCLEFLTCGKSMKEIAYLLNLSPRTVEFYLQNLKKKSGLNRSELIHHFGKSFPF